MEQTNTQPPVNIYLESNPNPNSMKFVVNFMLFPEGFSFDFPTKESTEQAPLAAELFNFDYVTRVFYMNNFITVTKSESKEWIEIQDEIKNFIKDFIISGKEVLLESALQEQVDDDAPTAEGGSDIEVKIKQILEEYVKPAVEQDGGAIAFSSFAEGTLHLDMQGACSGCPSSTVTLKAGIENLMKRMVPEVKEVVAEGV